MTVTYHYFMTIVHCAITFKKKKKAHVWAHCRRGDSRGRSNTNSEDSLGLFGFTCKCFKFSLRLVCVKSAEYQIMWLSVIRIVPFFFFFRSGVVNNSWLPQSVIFNQSLYLICVLTFAINILLVEREYKENRATPLRLSSVSQRSYQLTSRPFGCPD